MPQLQSIVLTDRDPGGPNNLTFVPRDILQGVGTVIESTGVPVGEKQFTVSGRKSGRRHIIELRLTVPVVATETINGVGRPIVVRTSYANVRFSFDEHSTAQERKDVVGMIESSLDESKTLTNSTLIDLEGVY